MGGGGYLRCLNNLPIFRPFKPGAVSVGSTAFPSLELGLAVASCDLGKISKYPQIL